MHQTRQGPSPAGTITLVLAQWRMHSPLPVLIVSSGPFQVVGAMRTTISNMVGVLPPQLFTVTVSTVGESLAQLMFSVLMTGGR